MDTKKNSKELICGTIYYGVYIPNDNKDLNGTPNVFEDKINALQTAKKNKKSRFKAFQFYHEALEFAQNGSEFPNNNSAISGSFSHKSFTETAQIGEKASPFKGPKPQELVELRKAIESNNYKFVKETIWQNPRYLVSSGDTPSILQEGARYNALHVAAKSKNAEIAELILNTVSSTDFVKLLYGDDNQQNAEDRTAVLLDLYLNTPNKSLNETPLHFASKHGAADVVEVLVSYPQCDKTLKNKFNQTAEQIICDRADGNELAAVKRKIEMLLKDSYYVPVLRAEDRSIPPLVGEPFSPTRPPILNKDPLSPRLEIHAYAGPMDKHNAEEFRKIWKTPPRSVKFVSSNKRKPCELISVTSLRFKDPDKGLERIGKKLANKYAINWKEYWPFLDNFVDITSEEGLIMLENYLAQRSGSFKDSRIIKTQTESTARKLFFNDSDGDRNFVPNGINISKNHNQIDLSSEEEADEEEEEYYTPPSSPSFLEKTDTESEDEFNDTELPKCDIFIKRDFPTKVDCEVFNALSYSEVKLDCKKYPNIYKWHHHISLYSEAERESWPNLKNNGKPIPDSPNSSFFLDSPKTSTPSKSWLRITGANSPKALLKYNYLN